MKGLVDDVPGRKEVRRHGAAWHSLLCPLTTTTWMKQDGAACPSPELTVAKAVFPPVLKVANKYTGHLGPAP